MVVKLRQSKAGSEGLVHAVGDGSLDIALTGSPNKPPRGITLHPLFSEPMVFVCLPEHPLSQHSSVAVRELQDEMILRPPPGWGTRTAIDAAFGATRSAFEIADYALMARLVRAGFATTLAPESAIRGEMLAGRVPFPSMTPGCAGPFPRPSARTARGPLPRLSCSTPSPSDPASPQAPDREDAYLP